MSCFAMVHRGLRYRVEREIRRAQDMAPAAAEQGFYIEMDLYCVLVSFHDVR